MTVQTSPIAAALLDETDPTPPNPPLFTRESLKELIVEYITKISWMKSSKRLSETESDAAKFFHENAAFLNINRYPNFSTILDSINMIEPMMRITNSDIEMILLTFLCQWKVPTVPTPNNYLSHVLKERFNWGDYYCNIINDYHKIKYELSKPGYMPKDLMYDLNLARLAFPSVDFIQNQNNLFSNYTAGDLREADGKMKVFNKRQKMVFSHFLKRSTIFATQSFITRFDSIARSNMENYVNHYLDEVKVEKLC